jgi:hypothetical protein
VGYLACEQAELTLARASEPIDASQLPVLFYFYSPDLISLREHLLAFGVDVSAITYPNYMPKGEIRIEDPDGYGLAHGTRGLIGPATIPALRRSCP